MRVVRFYGFTVIRFYGYTVVRFYGYTVVKFYGYTVVRFYGYTVVRLYGYKVKMNVRNQHKYILLLKKSVLRSRQHFVIPGRDPESRNPIYNNVAEYIGFRVSARNDKMLPTS